MHEDRSCYHPQKFYFPASGERGKLRFAPTTYQGPEHADGHGTHKEAWGSKTKETSGIGLKSKESSTWMTQVYTRGRDEAARQPGAAAHISAGGRIAPKGPSFSVFWDLPCEPISVCLFPPASHTLLGHPCWTTTSGCPNPTLPMTLCPCTIPTPDPTLIPPTSPNPTLALLLELTLP